MIDKKITWTLVFAISIESAGAFAWVGGAAERLKDLEARVAAQTELADRLARVEIQLELAAAQANRIESRR